MLFKGLHSRDRTYIVFLLKLRRLVKRKEKKINSIDCENVQGTPKSTKTRASINSLTAGPSTHTIIDYLPQLDAQGEFFF